MHYPLIDSSKGILQENIKQGNFAKFMFNTDVNIQWLSISLRITTSTTTTVTRTTMMAKRTAIAATHGMFGSCVDLNYKKYNNTYMYLNSKLNSYH